MKKIRDNKNDIDIAGNTANQHLKQNLDQHITTLQTTLMSELETQKTKFQTYVNNVKNTSVFHNSNSTPTEINKPPVPQVSDEITYVDPTTKQHHQAWVASNNDDDPDDLMYTIRFSNNISINTKRDNILPTVHAPPPVKSSTRFPNVDPTLLGNSSPHSSPPFSVPPQNHTTSSTQFKAPDTIDIKSFHYHFKGKLKDDDDILTFYNQLRSQGR